MAGNRAGNPVKFAGNENEKPVASGLALPGLLPELRFLLESLLVIQLVNFQLL